MITRTQPTNWARFLPSQTFGDLPHRTLFLTKLSPPYSTCMEIENSTLALAEPRKGRLGWAIRVEVPDLYQISSV
jgi:hypothetical protein